MCTDIRYVGKMSRDEAEMNLEKHPVGTYLIRLSTTSGRQGEYALSVRWVSLCACSVRRMHCRSTRYILLELTTINACWCCRAAVGVRHIRIQRSGDGSYYLADCRHFNNVIVRCAAMINWVSVWMRLYVWSTVDFNFNGFAAGACGTLSKSLAEI